MEKKGNEFEDTPQVKSLVIVFSYNHNNTEKIANACAKVLSAEVKTPQQVKPEDIAGVRSGRIRLGDLQCDIRPIHP